MVATAKLAIAEVEVRRVVTALMRAVFLDADLLEAGGPIARVLQARVVVGLRLTLAPAVMFCGRAPALILRLRCIALTLALGIGRTLKLVL